MFPRPLSQDRGSIRTRQENLDARVKSISE